MKTVKEMSEISNVSIRTLRYYDEIGLLKPTDLTAKGYRLYDNKALEKLQQIMFFRELEIPLVDIKKIMENPDFDKEQILITQKSLLEKKRNRLNGLIDLINDVMKGVNTMSFEAFSNDDIQLIINHTLKCMSEENLKEQIKKYGSVEKYREILYTGFQNEQSMADLLKWYGSKEKIMEAVLGSTGEKEELTRQQNENDKVYQKMILARDTGNMDLEIEAVKDLSDVYKDMFKIDNARAILLDLAKEYLQNEKLAEATDSQYGNGCAIYVAKAIQNYFGE
ncbi:MAG: mta 2 [Anaerocolumna sp.]|jgi:DNA-binding transcriptional MerR regulator|nr:mta 2 [Anaerocolumna sp.]